MIIAPAPNSNASTHAANAAFTLPMPLCTAVTSVPPIAPVTNREPPISLTAGADIAAITPSISTSIAPMTPIFSYLLICVL